jgi:hypothetical protein
MVHVLRGNDESDHIALVTESWCDSNPVRKFTLFRSADTCPNYLETGIDS